MKWNVLCVCYDFNIILDQIYAMSNLLLMNIETTITIKFVSFVRILHAMNRLNRIVLDESHLLLTTTHYRRKIVDLSVLRRISCLFVCMTIILLFFVELQLKTLLHFTQCETLRANNDRSNFKYRVQSLNFKSNFCREKNLISRVAQICMQNMQKWTSILTTREICYVRRKVVVEKLLTTKLNCLFYNANLFSHEQRQKIIVAWSQNFCFTFVICKVINEWIVDRCSFQRE